MSPKKESGKLTLRKGNIILKEVKGEENAGTDQEG